MTPKELLALWDLSVAISGGVFLSKDWDDRLQTYYQITAILANNGFQSPRMVAYGF